MFTPTEKALLDNTLLFGSMVINILILVFVELLTKKECTYQVHLRKDIRILSGINIFFYLLYFFVRNYNDFIIIPIELVSLILEIVLLVNVHSFVKIFDNRLSGCKAPSNTLRVMLLILVWGLLIYGALIRRVIKYLFKTYVSAG